MKTAFTSLVLFVTMLVSSQEINKLDANGKNHGVWRKNFENTNVIRYEGEFLHGKDPAVVVKAP